VVERRGRLWYERSSGSRSSATSAQAEPPRGLRSLAAHHCEAAKYTPPSPENCRRTNRVRTAITVIWRFPFKQIAGDWLVLLHIKLVINLTTAKELGLPDRTFRPMIFLVLVGGTEFWAARLLICSGHSFD
jgi:hypothetical protein